ncbi:trans-L-3-hydroxyproline dehydratase [Herbaspirillum sp. Sphag1AN]|uniref:trans-3-hydroxy-L-proline dehydratase n=1 Tax=unclassified Herbaspirillum TaxID=2624150 RepID=UPI00161139C7|nr:MULTISPECIES: trans-3-hydroxy-L-proline dehydratase [unclassified Herbaspirillum]MBB3214722.1 trans-L-3-hydroxyproline dehydratase [Herbaspirillum sp. Sphag1AN]MBB3247918.1 trans-L-3-hydroxyproline dehydratase [Herbaspirillum sp. Sphag64]
MLSYTRTVQTIDAHTGGEPLRIIVSGLPPVPGGNILEKRDWLKQHRDDLRQFLINEPRGHADMYGAYLLPPITPNADFGVIFIHNEGYSDMCGHGIIALGKVLVEMGYVERTEPTTRICFDAPAGFIEARVEWDGVRAGKVTFKNVPAFIYARDVVVETPSFGQITGDIVFGGAFYYYINADQAGLSVKPEQVRQLIQLGAETKAAVKAKVSIVHPLEPGLNTLYGTIIDSAPQVVGADQSNVCIFADREVDRSPTGTGTSGRAAQLFLRDRLALNQDLVNASIVGSKFSVRVTESTRVGAFDGVITEVTGSAHIMSTNQWVLEDTDPFPTGFFLR